MALSQRDRDVLWSAIHSIVMAWEHGALSLDEAQDAIEMICVGTAIIPIPDEK